MLSVDETAETIFCTCINNTTTVLYNKNVDKRKMEKEHAHAQRRRDG